jgi:excisionase family DNA binding protein
MTTTPTVAPPTERERALLDELIGDAGHLTTGQLAAALRVCKMTVLRMIDAGELHAVRWPRPVSPYRIPRSEVLRVMRPAWREPPHDQP